MTNNGKRDDILTTPETTRFSQRKFQMQKEPAAAREGGTTPQGGTGVPPVTTRAGRPCHPVLKAARATLF